MKSPEAFFGGAEENNTHERGAEKSFQEVSAEIERILNVLEEGLAAYSEVTLPSGEAVPTENEAEALVARAQRLLEGIKGVQEQLGNNYHAERATGLIIDAVTQLTEYLSIRADLRNEVSRNPGAQKLADTLDAIMLKLLPRVSSNDAYYVNEEK